jgi:acyl-coenzyme A thioesterase PaaI-like protein
MSFSNRMRRTLAKADPLPDTLRRRAVSIAIRRTIPFVGTAGVDILEVTPTRVSLALENRRGVRNHIGGVHAAATALLAETASGLVLGMNVPDSAVPVLRQMRISYVRRASGGVRAVASLDDAVVRTIQDSDSGDIDVPVVVTDAEGAMPVECVMQWAWRPKR